MVAQNRKNTYNTMYYIQAGAINHFIPFVNKYDVLGQTTYSKKIDSDWQTNSCTATWIYLTLPNFSRVVEINGIRFEK